MSEIEYNKLIREEIIKFIKSNCSNEDKEILVNNTEYLNQIVYLVKNYTYFMVRKNKQVISCENARFYLNDVAIAEIISDFGFKIDIKEKTI